MRSDPIVEEVRRYRDEHAAKFNYDLDAIVDDIERRQSVSGRTYVQFPPKRPAGSVPPGADVPTEEQTRPELKS